MSEPFSYIVMISDLNSDTLHVLPELNAVSDNFSVLYTKSAITRINIKQIENVIFQFTLQQRHVFCVH